MSSVANPAGRPFRLLCPSAQSDWPTARIIGVVGGTPEQAQIAFLDEPALPNEKLLALAKPLQPTEVFRFTAPCASAACNHFGEGRCRLASKDRSFAFGGNVGATTMRCSTAMPVVDSGGTRCVPALSAGRNARWTSERSLAEGG